METPFYRKERKRIDFRRLLRTFLRSRKAVATAIIGVPFVIYFVFGSHGVIQRVRLEREKADLEDKIREAQLETKRLQEESKALDNDMKEIEKVAREKYNMVREGETLYKVNRNK